MATATRNRTPNKPSEKPADAAPAEKPVEKPVEKPTGEMSFTVEAAGEPIKRAAGKEKPNPLAGQVRASLAYPDARVIRDLSEEQVKTASNLLRRDAVKEGLGLRLNTRKNDNGKADLLFQGNEKKRQHTYTAQEIRDWATQNAMPTAGGGKKGGAIPKETREAFRKAMAAKHGDQPATENQPSPTDG